MKIPTPTLSKPQIWARLRALPIDGESRELPEDLHDAILALKHCPNCARFPELHYLMPLRYCPEDVENNAGYHCGNCEEFYVTENLYETGFDPNEWRCDADPGL